MTRTMTDIDWTFLQSIAHLILAETTSSALIAQLPVSVKNNILCSSSQLDDRSGMNRIN